MTPYIDANKAFAVLKQLKDALSSIDNRAIFISGNWDCTKENYAKLLQEWPVTDIGFHRWRTSGFFSKILTHFKYNLVLKLEDPAFLVNVFRIFKMDRVIAFWSIGKAEEADFEAALLAQSLELDGSSTRFWGNLIQFAPGLFYFHLLEDISYDEPFLFLHCGEKVPCTLKQIISDNNLEPYIEHTANH